MHRLGMNYMICTTCCKCIIVNNIGICLDCQLGKGGMAEYQKQQKNREPEKQQKNGQVKLKG